MGNNEEQQGRVNNSVHEHDGAASHTCGCGKIAWSVAKDGSHITVNTVDGFQGQEILRRNSNNCLAPLREPLFLTANIPFVII